MYKPNASVTIEPNTGVIGASMGNSIAHSAQCTPDTT